MGPDRTDDTLDRFETEDEARAYLARASTGAPADIDLTETALALGLALLPGLRAGRYRHHLSKLKDHLHEDVLLRQRMKEEDTLTARAQALIRTVHDAHGYALCADLTDPDAANLLRVIDTRRATPPLLALLYMMLARAEGWAVEALSFPDHVLIRLDLDGARIIIDPALGGREMVAHDLRRLLKSIVGVAAELSHDYYTPLTARDLLLRVQNGLKSRFVAREDYPQALHAVETMALLAPDDPNALFDRGILYVKLGRGAAAIEALESYLGKSADAQATRAARAILRMIRDGMV